MSRPPLRRIVHLVARPGDALAAELFAGWSDTLGLDEWDVQPELSSPEALDADIEAAWRDPQVAGVVVDAAVLGEPGVDAGGLPTVADGVGPVPVDCFVRAGGGVEQRAVAPTAVRRALGRIAGPHYWSATPHAEALCLGAGFLGRLVALELLGGSAGPSRLVVTDTSAERLDVLVRLVTEQGHGGRLEPVHVTSPAGNDGLLTHLPEGSLVVSAEPPAGRRFATPLTDAATLPLRAVVWDIAARDTTELLMLADEQAHEALLRTHDGWALFHEEWAEALALVTGREVTAADLIG